MKKHDINQATDKLNEHSFLINHKKRPTKLVER